MKAILVTTDFSESADNAVQLAQSIALKSGAGLYFLYKYKDIYEPVYVIESPFHTFTRKPAEIRARMQLEALVEQANHNGIDATDIFVFDHGIEKVSDYLDSYDIDLVVAGTHGIGGLKEWLELSSSDGAAQDDLAPVLITRVVPPSFEIREILFISAFLHDVYDGLRNVAELSKLFGATVRLLHISRKADSEKVNRIARFLESEYPTVPVRSHCIESDDLLWEIREYHQTFPADIVAVSRGEHDVSFFSRSIAESLSVRKDLPILIV